MRTNHKGVRIVPVKVTRYEVRDVTGRKLRTFSSTQAARAWIDGYLAASKRAMDAIERAERQQQDPPSGPVTPDPDQDEIPFDPPYSVEPAAQVAKPTK